MTVILDAGAALEIALEGRRGREFREILSGAAVVIAPDLFVSEVTNSFWKYRNFSDISDEQCLNGIEFCLSLIDDFRPAGMLWPEVIREATRLKHSTYDIFYLILARRTGGKILSCDKKLLRIAKDLNIDSV